MSSVAPSPAPELDLDACAREPIRVPGAIQPHGVLLAWSEPELLCTQVSANTAAWLNCPPAAILGQTLRGVLGADLHRQIEAALATGDPALVSPLTAEIAGRRFDALLHRHDGVLIVELEPVADPADGGNAPTFARHHRRLQTALAGMRAAPDLPSLYPIIARTVAALSGFDRVMVYRFDPDWHGEVVGEALSSPDVDSYLGLNYPATDIPAQARALYATNWLRLIATVAYTPAPLEPVLNPQTGQPLDLSFAALRSVSPIHLEYLRNMGVGASMSVSLVVDGQLWGLVACHHRESRFVSAAARAACELFGQAASTEVAAKQEAKRLAERASAQAVQTRFFDVISQEADVFGALVRYTPQLLEFLGAGGAAIWVDGRCTLLGRTPPREQIDGLIRWLQTQTLEPLLATDHLESLYPAATDWREAASGLLAVRLSRVEEHFVLWFRPEVLTSVRWAGNPHKPAEPGERLHPRLSFAEWREIVRGRSRPWSEPEQDGARELHLALNALVLRRSEGLLRLNGELERKNTDLHSFAHIAAHDLREPLRGIRNFSLFLREDHGASLDPEAIRKLDTITALSDRTDRLLEALLHYSDVGRMELQAVEIHLDALLDDALEGLSALLSEHRVDVRRPRPLPTVRGDPVLLGQVFTNLIVNAVKYTPDAPKWVEIGWREGRPEDGERGPVLGVRDGGIGIRPKHHAEVFHIFRRLHGRDQYGGGSGIGLAIVKNVVERHGGRVWIESDAGAGTTVWFTLR